MSQLQKILFPLIAFSQTLSADFAIDLFDRLSCKDENWVFSPFSISSCLSMVKDGARGMTADEISDLLDLPANFEDSFSSLKHIPISQSDFALDIAQGIWIRDDFSICPCYSSLLEQTYGAQIDSVSFVPATADLINGWISEKTHRKIQNLLSPSLFSPATRMVLVNALYFSGNWTRPFPTKATEFDTFESPSSSLLVPFMQQTNTFPYFENGTCKALLLSLSTQSDTCEPACLLLLPHGSNDNFWLTSELIKETLHSAREESIRVRVPKFQIEKTFDLKAPLQQMGMQTVFSHRADLSGIDGHLDLFLSDVLHKSFFSFEEQGVEAAAATAALVNCSCGHPKPFHSFIADHPFYFVLLDKKSETILFIGYIQNPCS